MAGERVETSGQRRGRGTGRQAVRRDGDLAQAVLRERLVRAQVAGLGAAVTAVVLITLPG